jgi:hypothetical protein
MAPQDWQDLDKRKTDQCKLKCQLKESCESEERDHIINGGQPIINKNTVDWTIAWLRVIRFPANWSTGDEWSVIKAWSAVGYQLEVYCYTIVCWKE